MMLGCNAQAPSEPIPLSLLELVNAILPFERKGERLVVTWKASFDESAAGQGEGWFVSAGIVATLQEWRLLEAEWKRTLRAKPSICCFHYNHAGRTDEPGTVFHNWSPSAVQRKIGLLARVIRAHSQRRLLVAFRQEHFTWAVNNCALPRKYRDPYIFGFFGCLMANGKYMGSLSKPQRKPVLVFDRWSDTRRERRATDIYCELACGVPDDGPIYETSKWLQRQPLFADDENEVCIQAADLVAGKWRHTLDVASEVGRRPRIPRVLGRRGEIVAYEWDHEDALQWQRAMTNFLREKRKRDRRGE